MFLVADGDVSPLQDFLHRWGIKITQVIRDDRKVLSKALNVFETPRAYFLKRIGR